MSIDSWGGGSDDDPKLRLKELARQPAATRRKQASRTPKPRPAITGLEIVIGLVVLILMAIAYASKR